MQFSSFPSFNIWTCSCAKASLLLFNSCFSDCLPPYFTATAEKEGPAGSILQKKINVLNSTISVFRITASGSAAGGLLHVCLLLSLPPSSQSQHKFSGTLVGLLMVCCSGLNLTVKGSKVNLWHHCWDGSCSSLKTDLWSFPPAPPLLVWNWVYLHQWVRVKNK